MSTKTTTFEQFRALAAGHRVVPVVRTVLADSETPLSAYVKLAGDRPGTFLLESAEHGRSWSRWSFIGCGAAAALTVDGSGEATWWGNVPAGAPTGGDPLDALRRTLDLLRTDQIPGLPPLTSGMVGYLGYDIVRRLERIRPDTVDDLQVPEMVQLLATDLAAFDHHEGRIHLIANAVNWDGSDERVEQAYADAVARVDSMTARLADPGTGGVSVFDTPAPDVRRCTDEATYHARVADIIEQIYSGEAFQVVLSQRFEVDTAASPRDVYRILRTTNPSPYMFLMTIPDGSGEDGFGGTAFTIVGSSPEALVTVQDGAATTHPIAGTRPRGDDDEHDVLLAKDLVDDAKENAEHLMLVDLGRNDLGRVCVPGTVEVTEFRQVERYSHVMHLVSTVTGRLADGQTGIDAVTACFPAGTLSGSPKPRALQIIEDLEDTRRGVYGGVVGYVDFAGNTDQAIAIRSAVIKDGTAYVQAGAGIVADSVAASEDAECRNKAMAVLRAVAAAETLRDAGEGR
ncbi:anthranilate synthase component 1 [Dietzia kunjamensis subsp. schimae]|uniref:Anthranilate synthase component 1 n=1 Tax=Dietzia kunjamensis subsp. schimae TaxID=498198 RepID=A0ABY1N6M9_9ACTN|nr:anthranilate synthase component I [Dietzia kunjamensis]MBB1014502.1 anthranilate synthase component I [Dietzia kunjamensis subsp. schimae]SMO87573.1 anthranilate synthase component 1 [Dietzia kunjamensis subsp. schimae]